MLRTGLADAQMQIESQSAGFKAPQVVDGFLPPKNSQQDQVDYPFVVVRPISMRTESRMQSTAEVKIGVGAFCDTYDGHIDVALIMANINRIILQAGGIGYSYNNEPASHGVVFELAFPIDFEIYEQQPEPEYMGHIITRWNIPTPQRQILENEDI